MIVINGVINGYFFLWRLFLCGIYVFIMIFFDVEIEDFDIFIIKKYVERLVKDGFVGFVIMGFNGEVIYCICEEKLVVIKVMREVFDEVGFIDIFIIIGVIEGSVWGMIELCKLVKDVGVDYVLFFLLFYFWFLMDE